MGGFVNVNASEDQEMITSNQVLEDGFLEETEEEEFLNFSTKVNVDWTVKPQILKRSKGFTKKAGSIIYINLKIFPHKKVRIGVIKGGKVKKYYTLFPVVCLRFVNVPIPYSVLAKKIRFLLY